MVRWNRIVVGGIILLEFTALCLAVCLSIGEAEARSRRPATRSTSRRPTSRRTTGRPLPQVSMMDMSAMEGPLPPEAIKALSSYSPSVRHAAILKYRPPANWIQFYLPDDRYLIGGNIWRVVSTELDVYYHRPNCPNMRRQSPNIVLGFPSPRLAEEAGYRPDTTCEPQEALAIYGAGGLQQAVNTRSRPVSITLADGYSTALLPPGWRHRGQTHEFQGRRVTIDMFQPPSGRGMLTIATFVMPPNLNVQSWFTPKGYRANMRNFESNLNLLGSGTGVVDTRLSNATNNVRSFFNSFSVKGARVGGLPGLQMSLKRGANLPGTLSTFLKGWRSFSAARGSKIYSVDDYTQNAKGADTIIRGFRAR
ncbi:MAG: hypothetical protein M3347_07850 [Armatimonadota bacterium]|nr:hypothetical protein [Armatimonadota bacterium]